jgi:Mrp family chromosome partitioning ATPase
MLGVDLFQLVGTGDGLRPIEVFPNLKVVSMALISRNANAPIVWRGPIKHKVIQQFIGDVEWGDLDYLIVDLPPGTGDEPLSVAHLIDGVDGSIIVTTPQEVALLDSRKAVEFSRLLNIPVLGIVENMSGMICPHCAGEIDLFKVGGGEKAADELKIPFLCRIPIDADMVTLCDDGKPFVLHRPYSKAKRSYNDLAQTVLAQLRETFAAGRGTGG